MKNPSEKQVRKELQDANSCIALGAGVGALGTGTVLLTGATCPLCVVVAPALIGFGVWKRFTAGRLSCLDEATVNGQENKPPS